MTSVGGSSSSSRSSCSCCSMPLNSSVAVPIELLFFSSLLLISLVVFRL